ncbi:related to Putative uracil phosphoribosyltransferase urg2 [Ramularia collo-cygni]|uniref:uracil phosphoribosyltransferase n=1 Tax=Ramularia collo-cygni TaxID=112498 RepID=A0A2D3VKD3_9PEZI|nr:related to Putative uracil phosphoribosyltransferase urg2 [Ramularia collo-cygni]CZT21473.1 related to Putative uracil phosphoribosyltransferase urg2 [Ramularia collo-cygni]
MPSETINIVRHPCLKGKLSLLEDRSTPAAQVRSLVTQATYILATEASREISSSDHTIVVPVMRSGLAMVDATLEILCPSHPTSVYHLGLFRDSTTLEAIEYYNNIPTEGEAAKNGLIVDPLLATGATVTAAIDSLKRWGIEKIIVVALLATNEAIERITKVHPTGVQFFVGDVQELSPAGKVVPGVGDMGDRLYFRN